MDISEKKIREKSRDIIAAYKDATGCDVMLSVEEFLLLRSAAVSEIRNGYGGDRSDSPAAAKPVSNTPVASPVTENNDNVQAIRFKKPSKRTSPQNHMHQSSVNPSNDDIMDDDTAELSDFELLRLAGDPWNS